MIVQSTVLGHPKILISERPFVTTPIGPSPRYSDVMVPCCHNGACVRSFMNRKTSSDARLITTLVSTRLIGPAVDFLSSAAIADIGATSVSARRAETRSVCIEPCDVDGSPGAAQVAKRPHRVAAGGTPLGAGEAAGRGADLGLEQPL